MREIKFRAWDKHKRTMFVFPMDDYNTGDFFENDSFEVMQYTGLKDRNGKDIYENDVVKYRVSLIPLVEEKRVVVWYHSGFGFKNVEGEDGAILYLPTEKIEVIGNVHKNPELLK